MTSRAIPSSIKSHGPVRRLVRRAAGRAFATCALAAVLAAAASSVGLAGGPRASGRGGRFAAKVASSLPAGNRLVVNAEDSGFGTLRQAIADAAPGDTIGFDLVRGSTIKLTSGELVIDKNLSIVGPGASALSVSGGNQSRVFHVTSDANVQISGLTIRDGTFFGADGVGGVAAADGNGGDILNSGTLTLTTCTISGGLSVGGSSLVGNRGSSGFGGGIDNSGTLTLNDCAVSDNSAIGGGGTPAGGSAGGGGINNQAAGKLMLTGSTVSGNKAQGGSTVHGSGGGASGGGILNAGSLVIVNSTVSDNTVEGRSVSLNGLGGGSGFGGGIENSGALTLKGSTVSDNRASGGFGFGGGQGGGGGVNNEAAATCAVTESTVNNNLVRGGSGVPRGASGSGGGLNNLGTLTLTNSTVSSNSAFGGTGTALPDGPAQGGGLNSQGTLTLTCCTITLNYAGTLTFNNLGPAKGGGVNVSSGATRPLDTIIAGNLIGGDAATSEGFDVSGTFDSQGRNLIGRNDGAESSFPACFPGADCAAFAGTAASPIDARLGPLANNGGPTKTHRPWPGSPALEAGQSTVLFPPFSLTNDQRGPGFSRLTRPVITIGALEPDAPVHFGFAADTFNVDEGDGQIEITVTRSGDLAPGDTSVDYLTSDGTASARSDYGAASGTLHFASGETSKTFTVLVTDDNLVEGDETVHLSLSGPLGGADIPFRDTATLTIKDNDAAAPSSNPSDDAQFFVRQHYHDFLSREPDDAGLRFWAGQINDCGADSQCREVERVNVSAAFFLSIEFQETGFFALRARRAAFGQKSADAASRVALAEFLRDARQLGEGVVVGQDGWQQRLEQNRQAYLERLVNDFEFAPRHPASQPAATYVDALFSAAGVTPTASERQSAISAYLAGGVQGRAAALRSIAESASVTQAELNSAFVLMQYFGYLRRNPVDAPDANDAGYQSWLAKLNQFNGDFVRAEMVRAFIESAEYRQRFGPQ
jgi:Calx-beta domain/Domain of unknown function (DUF4214)